MMLSKEIVVVDYHRGNLQSVVRGLSAVGGFAVASTMEIGRASCRERV